MDINHLISQYGYAALIVGSMAEGETITLLGGVAAHQGLLKFPLVVIAVALGGMIGDQLLYLVGRRFGGRILRRFASQKARIRKAQRMIQHRPWLFVIGTRFMYGKIIVYVADKFSFLDNIMNFIPVAELFHSLVPISLLLGVGIGFVGSRLTIKKHLKV